jgi:hypothetical protein
MDNLGHKSPTKELENAAIAEILKETHKAAIRAEVGGPSGWTSKRKGLNKRFLSNTVINTVSENSRVNRKYKVPSLQVPISGSGGVKLPPSQKTVVKTTTIAKSHKISSTKKSHFNQCLKLFASAKKSEEKKKLEKLAIEKGDEKTVGGDGNDTPVGENLDTAW